MARSCQSRRLPSRPARPPSAARHARRRRATAAGGQLDARGRTTACRTYPFSNFSCAGYVPMSSSWNHTIHQLAAMIAARETNVERIVDSALQAITTHNPSLRAFTRVEEHAARRDARTADREIATGGHRGPLHGIPISIKDLIDISGVPTTAASRTSSSIPAPKNPPAFICPCASFIANPSAIAPTAQMSAVKSVLSPALVAARGAVWP